MTILKYKSCETPGKEHTFIMPFDMKKNLSKLMKTASKLAFTKLLVEKYH